MKDIPAISFFCFLKVLFASYFVASAVVVENTTGMRNRALES